MSIQLFRDLTWGDLSRWSGAAILERGKNYKRSVSDLTIIGDNHFAANVQGQHRYSTEVWFEDGDLKYRCDCAFSRGPCKHAIAVILVALEHVKTETPIPTVDGEQTVSNSRNSIDPAYSSDYRLPRMDSEKLRAVLQRIRFEDLIDWATRQIIENPDLVDDLPRGVKAEALEPDIVSVSDGQIDSIRQLIRNETERRFDVYAQDYHDRRYRNEPDYRQIEKEFQTLTDHGRFSELIELGIEFMALGTTQIDETQPGNGPFARFRNCMTMVVDAIRSSDLPLSEKVINYWELLLEDDYKVLSEVPTPIGDKPMSRTDWSLVAQHFTTRLKSMPRTDPEKDFMASYDRNEILERSIEALQRANQIKDALDLMESELENCNNYVQLVDSLIQIRDFEKARYWIVEGRRKNERTDLNVFRQLAEKMQEIAVLEEKWPQVAALAVYFFLHDGGVDAFLAVKDACERIESWDEVRPTLLQFLETGAFDPTREGWLLPETGLGAAAPIQRNYAPYFRQLIGIAIEENRLDDAVAWYRQAPLREANGLQLADILKDSQPAVAVEIWQREIAYLIQQVDVSSYLEAMPLLSNVKDLMGREGWTDEYRQYVEKLRTRHKRKSRLLKEIDLVESSDRRILDS